MTRRAPPRPRGASAGARRWSSGRSCASRSPRSRPSLDLSHRHWLRSDRRRGDSLDQGLRGLSAGSGASHVVCGSPSQQPSLNRQRPHCHVPWRHSIAAPQRQQLSLSVIDEPGYGDGRTATVLRVRLLLAGLLTALVAAAAAPAADVSLTTRFPEGLTVRRMADTVSDVRQIAIHKRHVTPVLTGRAYSAAAAGTTRPAGFPRGRSIEGFLFPSTYFFGPSTTAGELIRLQLGEFAKRWATVTLGPRRPYDVLRVASMIERETKAPEER